MKKLYLLLLPFLISGTAFKAVPSERPLLKPANEVDNYYKNIDPNASSYQLIGQLRDLMFTTHERYLSWSDLGGGEKYMETDYDPEHKETHFIDFYTQESAPREWGNGRTYNREHVWCASRSNYLWDRKEHTPDGKEYSDKGGGVDIHHIRPSYADTNMGRNNDKFTEYPKDQRIERKTNKNQRVYGWTIPNAKEEYFEPKDSVKGDVARILLYQFVHYSSPEEVGKNLPIPTDQVIGNPSLELYHKGHLIRTGSLPITEIIVKSQDEPTDVVGSWKLLLKWNEEDPVDQYEKNRNEGAYAIQGNRNPFIDHPEWAKKAFVINPDEIDTPSDDVKPLDTKTIIIIAVATSVLAITIITVVVLVYRNKRKRM